MPLDSNSPYSYYIYTIDILVSFLSLPSPYMFYCETKQKKHGNIVPISVHYRWNKSNSIWKFSCYLDIWT